MVAWEGKPLFFRSVWSLVDFRVSVDGPSPMCIWVAQTRLSGLKWIYKYINNDKRRTCSLEGEVMERPEGSWRGQWWVVMIKMHCMHVLNFQRIKIKIKILLYLFHFPTSSPAFFPLLCPHTPSSLFPAFMVHESFWHAPISFSRHLLFPSHGPLSTLTHLYRKYTSCLICKKVFTGATSRKHCAYGYNRKKNALPRSGRTQAYSLLSLLLNILLELSIRKKSKQD